MNNSKFGIVLASDENYLPYVWPLVRDLKTILSFCPPIVLLFDGELVDTEKLKVYCSDLDIDLQIISISERLSKDYLNTIRHITRATFARIFAVDFLKDKFDKILYLDIDLLIVRDFSYIFDIELTQTLAAVPENFDSMHSAFSTYDFSYFNAGVLLIDTQRWSDEGILETCLKVLNEKGPFNCQDQDALNLVFQNCWQVLPPTSNVMVSIHDHSMDLPQLGHPAIVHFVGANKPWRGFAPTRWHKIWVERNADLEAYFALSLGSQRMRLSPKNIRSLIFVIRPFLIKLVMMSLKLSSMRSLSQKLKLNQSKVLRRILGFET
jgi:lipopolysaccharide biosynthesis glycosyltransferase